MPLRGLVCAALHVGAIFLTTIPVESQTADPTHGDPSTWREWLLPLGDFTAELARHDLVLPRRPGDSIQEWSINHRIIFAAVNLHDVTRWREVPVPWFYAGDAAESAAASMPEEWDFTDDLAALPVPVLVVAGDDDFIPIASHRAWTAEVPNAQLVQVEGAGHISWIDRPRAVLTAVMDYLAGVR
jgi:pimeloyl-ACP methyl ester carboxylesterase